MWYAIGVVTGIAISALMGAVAVYFRRPIQRTVARIERAAARLEPEQRGYIFEPEDDAEIARRERIEENSKAGRETKISELM